MSSCQLDVSHHHGDWSNSIENVKLASHMSDGISIGLSLWKYRHRREALYLALGFQSTICLKPEPELDMHKNISVLMIVA